MADSHSVNNQLSRHTSIFGLRLWVVLGVCVGAAIVLLLVLISLWFIYRRSNKNKALESSSKSNHTIVPVVSKEIQVDPSRPPIQPDPTPETHQNQAVAKQREDDSKIHIEIGKDHRISYPERGGWTGSGSGDQGLLMSSGPEVSHLGWGHWYTLRELEVSTNGFADENVIGQGGYGIVYRGVLEDKSMVAIKNLLNNRGQAEKEFKVEVEAIGRVRHKNLMSSGNDYSRFLSTQNVAAPARSHSRSSRNCNPSSPASQNQQAVGSTPPPSNPNSPNPSHSANQLPLNSLTLDELLDSPGRASLKRLDPRRPPGTLWFDDDPQVAGTVRSIFERDFKEPHANWTQTPEPVVNRWYETFAQVYNWDRSINKRVRMEFETKLKDRMCDQISRWKGKWKRKGDEAKPNWIDPEVWAGLVRYWLDPQSEIRSINARNARYHDPDGLGIHKHRSGQTSFKARARKRCERMGDTTPDFLVLLDETHRKPDGTFINRKSEELYKEVTSRIEEEESQLCSVESSASGGLSVAAKNKIYAEVAPRKKGRIYGVGSLQNDATSVHVGPLPTHNDREVLLEKLAAAEARLQLQAEKINSFDAYWEYLAEKDPVFAGMFRGPSEPANADATRTAEGDQTGTDQTGTDQTATGTRPASSTSQAF